MCSTRARGAGEQPRCAHTPHLTTNHTRAHVRLAHACVRATTGHGGRHAAKVASRWWRRLLLDVTNHDRHHKYFFFFSVCMQRVISNTLFAHDSPSGIFFFFPCFPRRAAAVDRDAIRGPVRAPPSPVCCTVRWRVAVRLFFGFSLVSRVCVARACSVARCGVAHSAVVHSAAVARRRRRGRCSPPLPSRLLPRRLLLPVVAAVAAMAPCVSRCAWRTRTHGVSLRANAVGGAHEHAAAAATCGAGARLVVLHIVRGGVHSWR